MFADKFLRELQDIVYERLSSGERHHIVSNYPSIFATYFAAANLRPKTLPLNILSVELDLEFPRTEFPAYAVPSFDGLRPTAIRPCREIVKALYRVTAYNVDVKALHAFLGNTSLHRSILPLHHLRSLRIRSTLAAVTGNNQSHITVDPGPSDYLIPVLQYLGHIAPSSLESRQILITVHIVLPQHIVSSSISLRGRFEHLAVVVRAVLASFAALCATPSPPA
jgi:hypothetical protein